MPNQWIKLPQLLITLLIPIVVVGGVVNLLATDSFLAFEYSKPNFPPDSYGMTQRQRFVLASTNIHYVRAHLPDDELAKQTQDGIPVYNAREVAHMADVQAVFLGVFRTWQMALILLLILGFLLWRIGGGQILVLGIKAGGLLTSGMILSIGLLAVFAWQFWFNTFHLFFFKPGSWLFSYSDTLIRLFPVDFWFDATLTISVLSFAGGLAFAFFGWRWQKIESAI